MEVLFLIILATVHFSVYIQIDVILTKKKNHRYLSISVPRNPAAFNTIYR